MNSKLALNMDKTLVNSKLNGVSHQMVVGSQHKPFVNRVFFRRLDSYIATVNELKTEIDRNPENWQKYQFKVSNLIDSIFNQCAEFELENINNVERVLKLKKLFIRHFRKYFRFGSLNRAVINKPYGYAGDFKIIDEIYLSRPTTIGVERCLDNYFLETPASIATKNRKEDFKLFVIDFVKNLPRNEEISIMSLGCGPCRDIKEILENDAVNNERLYFDCVDVDDNAINYARSLLAGQPFRGRVFFHRLNVLKMALTKNISRYFTSKYDLIISAGLFDYLNDNISFKLLTNLKKLLKPRGALLISNYRDKYSNPSRFYMEWGGDWNLIYRTEHEFLKLFQIAGFKEKNLSLKFEKQKIMQYCIARNTE